MALGILNTMAPCLWQFFIYWWNEVKFSSTTVPFERLYLVGTNAFTIIKLTKHSWFWVSGMSFTRSFVHVNYSPAHYKQWNSARKSNYRSRITFKMVLAYWWMHSTTCVSISETSNDDVCENIGQNIIANNLPWFIPETVNFQWNRNLWIMRHLFNGHASFLKCHLWYESKTHMDMK